MRRDCCKVIDQIKEKVPNGMEKFLGDLEEVRKDA